MLISIISQGAWSASLSLSATFATLLLSTFSLSLSITGYFEAEDVYDFPYLGSQCDHRGFLSIEAVAVTLITKGFTSIGHPGGHWCRVLVDGWSSFIPKERFRRCYRILVMTSCNSGHSLCDATGQPGFYSDTQNWIWFPITSGIKRDYHQDHLCDPGDCRYALLLDTKLGQAYIATGDNPEMAKSFGIHTSWMMGLVVSNWDYCLVRYLDI